MARLRIKEIATQKGLRQKDIIERADVTPQLIGRYWHGHTLHVSLDQLQKIADALGVQPGELIAGDEEESQEHAA